MKDFDKTDIQKFTHEINNIATAAIGLIDILNLSLINSEQKRLAVMLRISIIRLVAFIIECHSVKILEDSTLIKCNNCGNMTNIFLSNTIDTYPEAGKCFASLDNNKVWIKGCAYNEAEDISKQLADKIIGNKS